MKEKTNLPPSLLEHTPWETVSNLIWPSTLFILHRNIARYNFPAKMADAQFKQVLSILSELFLKSSDLEKARLLRAEDLNAHEREFLFEHFLSPDGFQNAVAGQGFIVDNTGKFLALLNFQDHLQIELIDCQGSWESVWNKLNQIEVSLGSIIDFAYSPRFGYLTSDPAQCGTGLIVQAYLHLPALIHSGQLRETLLKHGEEGTIASGMGGTLDDLVGDLIVLRNSYTLGFNEENILHNIHSMAMKLMSLEKTLRTHLKNEDNIEIKDQVSRAYGLLLHSYQLQTKEALSALSLIKLGLDLDWIGGLMDNQINPLFFKCQRAHLSELVGEILADSHEASRKRAEFLHKQMQGMVLKIVN